MNPLQIKDLRLKRDKAEIGSVLLSVELNRLKLQQLSEKLKQNREIRRACK